MHTPRGLGVRQSSRRRRTPVEGQQQAGFTVESEGYGHYLYRRPLLPKLGWIAGLFGIVVAAIILAR